MCVFESVFDTMMPDPLPVVERFGDFATQYALVLVWPLWFVC